MADVVPILTPKTPQVGPQVETEAVKEVSRILTAFDKNVSFVGEKLSDTSSSIKESMERSGSKDPSATRSSPVEKQEQMRQKREAQQRYETEKHTSKRMEALGSSLQNFGKSLSSSILGDVSFLTQPFMQIKDIFSKGFSFLKGDKKDRVRPKREELLKHGVEGTSSVFIVDWLRKLMGDDGGDVGGGFFDKLLGGLGLGSVAATLFPALLKVLPFAALAGSIIWSVIDGIRAVGLKGEWGVNAVSAFIGGFFGGTGEGWENVLPQAAQGALGGLAVGLMAFGPIGAIAGLIIGAVVGGILGYIGGEAIAKFMDKTWEWAKENMKDVAPIAGTMLGGTLGFFIAGPVGLVAGALLGTALGGVLTILHEQGTIKPETLLPQLIKIPMVSGMIGALALGTIGLALGPVGLIAGALLGLALGSILGPLISDRIVAKKIEDEIGKEQIKRILEFEDDVNAGRHDDDFLMFDMWVNAAKLYETQGSAFLALSDEAQEAVRKRFAKTIATYEAEKAAEHYKYVRETSFEEQNMSFIQEGSTPVRLRAVQAAQQELVDEIKETGIQQEYIKHGDYYYINPEEFNHVRDFTDVIGLSPEGILKSKGIEDPDGHKASVLEGYLDAGQFKARDKNVRWGGEGLLGVNVKRPIYKFHQGGIAPHEMPAILRKDEEVLSPTASKAYRSIISTQQDLDMNTDLNSIRQSLSPKGPTQLTQILSRIEQALNNDKMGATAVQTNIIRRYDSSNIMESLAAAVP